MPRGDLRGEAGVVTSPNATTLAGVTPTAAGLALLDDGDAAAQRVTLGVVIGTNVQAQDADLQALADNSTAGLWARTGAGTGAARTITGTTNLVTVTNGDGVSGNPTINVGTNVYQVGGTDVAVSDGGTGGSTPATARDGVLWASSGAINPSSPYTVVAGVDVVTLTSSKTVAPRALSNYVDGQRILVVNDSASSITATITPADGTIDGAASVALSVAAHGCVGCVRTSSSTWGSLQPGTMTANGIRWYISSGTLYAVTAYFAPGGSATDIGTPVAATVVDVPSYGVSLSGANLAVPAGVISAGGPVVGTGAWRATWALSDLLVPPSQFEGLTEINVSSVSGVFAGAAIDIGVGFGTSATAPQRLNGVRVPTSGSSLGYAFLVSAGGGLFTNATGGAGMTGCRNSQWYGTSVTTTYWMTRLDSGVVGGYNASGSAPSVTSTPTHLGLYIGIEAGTLTNTITFNDLSGYVRW